MIWMKRGEKMSTTDLEKKIGEVVNTLDSDKVSEVTAKLINEGANPIDVTNAFAVVLREIGKRYESGELYLVELLAAGESARKAISEIVEPKLKQLGVKRETIGKVLLGTVEGDIHDIGKNIVAALLSSAGFEIIDLGKDVPVEKFVQGVRESKPHIVGMSALMTTSMIKQRDIIEALKKENLRRDIKIVVGGAPTSQEWAEEIGCDAYGADAIEALKICKSLVGKS
jgi:5-methyltetrahydrofolate--homocysteine methyltransferase